MRVTMTLLALVSLSACDREAKDEAPKVAAKPVDYRFDGADYESPEAKLAHGKRLADVLDCTGCHGEKLQGKNVTADDPAYGDMNAPNVTLLLSRYSDAELERLIRHGEPKDGREFWFMPVESFHGLSDADLNALVAHLRTFEPSGKQLPPIRKGKGFQEDVDRGFGNAKAQVARFEKEPLPDFGPATGRGRYLTRALCTGCHNSKLQGYEGFTPDLDIAGTYSPQELETLLSTGVGKSKPDLGMMSAMGREIFSKLTPPERRDVVAYVKARADRPQPARGRSSRN